MSVYIERVTDSFPQLEDRLQERLKINYRKDANIAFVIGFMAGVRISNPKAVKEKVEELKKSYEHVGLIILRLIDHEESIDLIGEEVFDYTNMNGKSFVVVIAHDGNGNITSFPANDKGVEEIGDVINRLSLTKNFDNYYSGNLDRRKFECVIL